MKFHHKLSSVLRSPNVLRHARLEHPLNFSLSSKAFAVLDTTREWREGRFDSEEQGHPGRYVLSLSRQTLKVAPPVLQVPDLEQRTPP